MTAPTRTRRTGALAVAAALALAATSACTTSDPAGPGLSPAGSAGEVPSSSPPAATTTPSASPTASPSTLAVPEGFATDEQRSPSWPQLGSQIGSGTGVRVGRHATYDRVVYEFSGRGTPTFRVTYVDEPLDPVTGEPVEVAGDAFLAVSVTTVTVPGEDDPQPADVSEESLRGTVVAAAPAIWGGFEGYGEEFIGVRDGKRPFRVSILSNPTRLVVDLAK